MLQSAGHLGLEHEPLAVLGVVSMPLEDLLERHLAMQLLIVSHEDGPQPPLGMGRMIRYRTGETTSPPDSA